MRAQLCLILILIVTLTSGCSSTPKFINPEARAISWDVDSKTEFEYYWDQHPSYVTYYRGTRPNGTEILEIDSPMGVLLNSHRALVHNPKTKETDIYDIKNKRVIKTVKNTGLFHIQYIGGRRIAYTSNMPQLELKKSLIPEITLYPYYKSEPVTMKMGGAEAKHGKYSGSLSGNITNYSEFFFSCGKNYCINRFDGTKTVGTVLDYDLNVISDNLGVFSNYRTYPQSSLDIPQKSRVFKSEVLTDAGVITGSPLAKHKYLPLGEDGKLLPLPADVSGVAPIFIENKLETLGWVLFLEGKEPTTAKIFLGTLNEMPKDISSIPTAYEYVVVWGQKEFDPYYNVAVRTAENQWQLLPGSSSELKSIIGTTINGTSDDVRQELSKKWWASYYAANPNIKASHDHTRTEHERKNQEAFEASYARKTYLENSYPKMLADGSICNNFEVAQHHGTAGLNEYMRRCSIKNQAEYDAIKHTGADKNLLNTSSRKLMNQQQYDINAAARNQMREDSIRRQRYNAQPSQQNTAGTNQPYKAPSQGLSQQQRYEYEKQLDKNLKRAVGK